MKILFISVHGDPLAKLGSSQAGGQNNYVRQITQSLVKRGHKVDVATHWSNKKKKEIEYDEGGVRVVRIAAGQKRFVKKDNLRELLEAFFQELDHKLDLASYDIVHSNYWLSGTVGLMIKNKYSKPLVHTSHSLGHVKARVEGVKDEKRLSQECLILNQSDLVIATTEDEKKKILKLTSDQSNVQVVSIGVKDVFFQSPARVLPEQPRFMFTGRLNKAKGLFVLLAAFAGYLKCCGQDSRLIIAGGGPEDFEDGSCCIPKDYRIREALEPVKNHVEFIGSKSQAELAKLYSYCTALIVPSHYESFGMVASEAQAAGLPVIASRVGGLKNVVFHEQTGLLFKNKNAQELTVCMRRMAEDRQFNQKLGENAIRHARISFNWEQIASSLENLYEQFV